MEDSQKALDDFRKRYNIRSLPEQKSYLLKQISELEVEQAKTAAQISENKGTRASLVNSSSAGPGENRLGKETDLNVHAISDIKNRIADLRLKEEEMLAKYTENSYGVKSIRKELEEARKLLAAEEKTYHDKEVQTLNHSVEGLSDKQQTQRKHMSGYDHQLSRITNIELQLRELERQFRIDEENYLFYVKKMEEQRMFNAMDTEKMVNITVAEPALKPIAPIKPRKKLNMAVALLLGTFAGLGLAFTSEALTRTIGRSSDLEKCINTPVIGSIPHIPALKSDGFRCLPPARP